MLNITNFSTTQRITQVSDSRNSLVLCNVNMQQASHSASPPQPPLEYTFINRHCQIHIMSMVSLTSPIRRRVGTCQPLLSEITVYSLTVDFKHVQRQHVVVCQFLSEINRSFQMQLTVASLLSGDILSATALL